MPRITPVSWKVLECIFLKDGFHFERQIGDHRSYVKPGIHRPVVIPTYKEVDKDIILSNMRTAGMSRSRYFELLKQCKSAK
ncbi:MAG: type II toxin-antitoxin system HicA family toxin [Proteobacteria bacterium]|nr:type II toxin-antitoxin system HicA family toxin [Pseudomonadota bacterium]